MYCTVLRPISGPDGQVEAGQVVDTSTWRARNRDVLITRKYLRPEPTYRMTTPGMPEQTELATEPATEPAAKPGKKEH